MSNTQTRRRYIVQETAISGVINGLFSLLFAWLVFGQATLNADTLATQLLLDAIPQGLAIGFMGAFFASFLTRKRLLANVIAGCVGETSHLPRHPVLRALVFSVLGALSTVLFFVVWLFLIKGSLPSTFLIIMTKVSWGALLGTLVAYSALRMALVDYAVSAD